MKLEYDLAITGGGPAGLAAPYFIGHTYKELLCPVIAGGLISNKSEIEELLRKGVMAVSTSIKELW